MSETDASGSAGSEATKQCPFCAETIKGAAIVCRYCGRDLPATVSATSPNPVIHTAYPGHTIHPDKVSTATATEAYGVPLTELANKPLTVASTTRYPDLPPLPPPAYQPPPKFVTPEYAREQVPMGKPLSGLQISVITVAALLLIAGVWNASLSNPSPDYTANITTSGAAAGPTLDTRSPAEKKADEQKAAAAKKQAEAQAHEERKQQAEQQKLDALNAKAAAEEARQEAAYEATIAIRGDDVALLRGFKAHTDEYDSTYITGTVINESDSALRYAEVTFEVTDAGGNILESPMTNIAYVAPKGKWKFKINVMTDSAFRYRPVSVESSRAD